MGKAGRAQSFVDPEPSAASSRTGADATHGAALTAMLEDADRNSAYECAIRDAIRAFESQEGYAPRVLNVGCGTGALAAFSLRHGAAYVLALDDDQRMVDRTHRALGAAGFAGPRYDALVGGLGPGEGRPCFQPRRKFDLLVSDLHDPTSPDRSAYRRMAAALPHMRRFAGRGVYVVPQRVTVFAAIYDMRSVFASAPTISEALAGAMDAALPVQAPSGGEVEWRSSHELRVPLHHLEPLRIGEAVLRHESFDLGTETAAEGGARWRAVELPSRHFRRVVASGRRGQGSPFLVLEWEVGLFAGHAIKNRVAHMAELGPRNAAARHANWGFRFSRLDRAHVFVRTGDASDGPPTVHVTDDATAS